MCNSIDRESSTGPDIRMRNLKEKKNIIGQSRSLKDYVNG